MIARAGAARLACRHMSSPSVGVVGSSLGGGLNWYGRAYGLQCSAVTAVEVVLADGTHRPRHRRAGQRPAVGGPRRRGRLRRGHRAGIRPDPGRRPVRRDAGLGVAARPAGARRLGALGRGRARTRRPACCGCSARPTCRGCRPGCAAATSSSIDGAIVGDPRAAAEIIAPLRALRPEIDTFDVTPAASLARLHLEPEEPLAAYASSTLLAGLPPDAVEALVAAAGPGFGLAAAVRRGPPARRRAVPPVAAGRCAGPDRRRVPGAHARYRRTARAAGPTQREDAERVLDAVQPWGTGALYLSMVDDRVDERRGGAGRALGSAVPGAVRRRPRWVCSCCRTSRPGSPRRPRPLKSAPGPQVGRKVRPQVGGKTGSRSQGHGGAHQPTAPTRRTP